MTDEENADSSKPEDTVADRLLARADQEPEIRATLIERWAREKHWSCHEGIALAWSISPWEGGPSKLLRLGRPVSLPEEAEYYLARARSSPDPEFSSDRVAPLRFVAWADGAGLAFHSDWYDAMARPRSKAPQRSGQRGDLIKQRERLVELWSRAPYWSLAEGASLAFDLDPEKAVAYPATGYGNPWIKDHKAAGHLLKLAFRAVEVEVLSRNPIPPEFMRWAREMGVEFDQIWWDRVSDEKNELETPGSDQPFAVLKTREQDSLLKLVGGMALGFYGWKPDQLRNSATTDIASDLEAAGVSLDPDTIRKWLRKSVELLPREDP